MFSPVRCVSGKRAYEKQEDAEDALIRSRINSGEHGAKNIYLCDDCGHWHLTSKGPLSDLIDKYAREIQRARTGEFWKDRFR